MIRIWYCDLIVEASWVIVSRIRIQKKYTLIINKRLFKSLKAVSSYRRDNDSHTQYFPPVHRLCHHSLTWMMPVLFIPFVWQHMQSGAEERRKGESSFFDYTFFGLFKWLLRWPRSFGWSLTVIQIPWRWQPYEAAWLFFLQQSFNILIEVILTACSG